MIAVDAARWWGPVGWGYRELVGNLTASAIAFTAGFAVGHGPVKRRLAELREHQRWAAQHLAEVNAAVTGTPAVPHPTLGQVGPPVVVSQTQTPAKSTPRKKV